MLNRLNPLKYSFLFWQLDQMTYDVMKDSQASVDLYEAGEIDRTSVASDLVDPYASRDDFSVILTPTLTH